MNNFAKKYKIIIYEREGDTMENILFINSCIRAEDISRTYRICKAFLDRYTQLHDETTVTEIVLTKSNLTSLTQNDIRFPRKLKSPRQISLKAV